MGDITNSAVKSSKKFAKQVAKQMAQEPIEILKQAGKQVTGAEKPPRQEQQEGQFSSEVKQKPEEEKVLEQKLKIQGKQQLEKLEREIEEITQRKKAKEKENEIVEQKQKQAVEAGEEQKPLIEPVAKRPRNVLAIFGKKKPKRSGDGLQAERQKRRVERVMPPSG